MIPKINFQNTYNMNNDSIITYLDKVLDDARTGGSIGYLRNFIQYNEEIVGRVQALRGKKYYDVNDKLEEINDEIMNNFSGLEDIADS